MKNTLLCSIAAVSMIYSGSAMAQANNAQQQQGNTAAQAPGACAQLVRYIHQNPGNNVGISPERLQTMQQRGDQEACRDMLAQLETRGQGAQAQTPEQQGEDQGQIVVQQPAPSVRIDQAEPRIVVQQPQPDVAVTQPQPEIIVRQPAPQVTVNIPQPEIIVRMPDPQVRVSQAEPRVQVSQPEPNVEVVQPEQQAQVLMEQNEQPEVQVQRAQEEANVQVQRSGQPNVRYEQEEPQVEIQQAEGEPQIRFENMERDQAATQQAEREQTAAQRTQQGFQAAEIDREQAASEPATGAVSATGDMRPITSDELEGMDVVNAQGNQLGDVENLVVSTSDNRTMAIVAHGGFLGLGEKKVALPLENMALADDRLVVRGLTDDDIRAMPEWRENDPNFQAFRGDESAELSVMQ